MRDGRACLLRSELMLLDRVGWRVDRDPLTPAVGWVGLGWVDRHHRLGPDGRRKQRGGAVESPGGNDALAGIIKQLSSEPLPVCEVDDVAHHRHDNRRPTQVVRSSRRLVALRLLLLWNLPVGFSVLLRSGGRRAGF
jgi:hypothetical protein